MKARICFVDDEPQALESLRQSMSSLNASWECAFVPSGEEALARLAAEPFDAVVTKMHLPGMNGAELLQEVGRLRPRALRFILGEVADQEVVVNCLGPTSSGSVGGARTRPRPACRFSPSARRSACGPRLPISTSAPRRGEGA